MDNTTPTVQPTLSQLLPMAASDQFKSFIGHLDNARSDTVQTMKILQTFWALAQSEGARLVSAEQRLNSCAAASEEMLCSSFPFNLGFYRLQLAILLNTSVLHSPLQATKLTLISVLDGALRTHTGVLKGPEIWCSSHGEWFVISVALARFVQRRKLAPANANIRKEHNHITMDNTTPTVQPTLSQLVPMAASDQFKSFIGHLDNARSDTVQTMKILQTFWALAQNKGARLVSAEQRLNSCAAASEEMLGQTDTLGLLIHQYAYEELLGNYRQYKTVKDANQ
ncbi:hypothetical protein PROFUN_16819, partial [Planoprotostelium fungivorum]